MSEGLKEARDAGDPLASAMLSIHDLEAEVHTLTQQLEKLTTPPDKRYDWQLAWVAGSLRRYVNG